MQKSKTKNRYLVVINTCPGSITAKKIATTLVADQLAASVQVVPHVMSFYRWVGKVENSEEFLLFIKTTEERYPEVEARIKAMHPFELPDIIAVPVSGGLEAYLSWLGESTRSTH